MSHEIFERGGIVASLAAVRCEACGELARGNGMSIAGPSGAVLLCALCYAQIAIAALEHRAGDYQRAAATMKHAGFLPVLREGDRIRGYWLSANGEVLIPDSVPATPELIEHLEVLERLFPREHG